MSLFFIALGDTVGGGVKGRKKRKSSTNNYFRRSCSLESERKVSPSKSGEDMELTGNRMTSADI